MSFTNPFGTKTNGQTISGTEATNAGVAIERAVDGTNGGTYTPATVIDFQGEGIRFGGAGAGAWPRVTSRSVVRNHRLNVETQSGAANAAVRRQAGGTGMLTLSLNSNTISLPYILTTHAAAADEWHLIEIDRPIDGAVLATVKLVTALSVSDASGYTVAKFDVIRWELDTVTMAGATMLSGGVASDDHSVAEANAGTRKVQTITPNQNATIDTDRYRYGVYVEHPFGDSSGNSLFLVHELECTYTVTDVRPG